MRQKALIVEPTRLFQSILVKILTEAGLECQLYSSAKDAMADQHEQYAFILVSRTLEDISGEIFLNLFGMEFGINGALSILLTSQEGQDIIDDASMAGYDLVVSRNNLQRLERAIVRHINRKMVDLDARILFVEDAESVAEVTKQLLTEHNGRVEHVSDVAGMQQAFEQEVFDLVITDYYLANNETGDDVIEYVRDHQSSEKAQIPILVVSSESNKEKRVAFLRNGANDFIIKPYDDNELLVRASNLISNSKQLKRLNEQQQELMKVALTDHLTGLYNRHSLYDVGPRYLSNAKRYEKQLSLLLIDLDHFKQINDTHGHSVGDYVLKAVAEVIQSSCRSGDIAARFGGEEFVLILNNCDEEDALRKAEDLRMVIGTLNPEGIPVTTSIGVAHYNESDEFGELFDKADQAVYEAKDNGRDRVVVYQPPFD